VIVSDLLCGGQNQMAELRHRIGKRCADIVTLQIGEVGKDPIFAGAAGQHFEDIDHKGCASRGYKGDRGSAQRGS